jgi:hypothetical protein
MVSFVAVTSLPSTATWPLMARPGRWREWAPHIRGAWGLGDPEVQPVIDRALRRLAAQPSV